MAKKQAILYGIITWIRWVASSLPGYIHPDEYFQSPEITAGAILQVKTWTAWEFKPAYAARSILIPFLTTGFPFWLMRREAEMAERVGEVYDALTIFLVERSSCFILSLFIDFAVYRMCQILGRDPWLPLFIVATSHVMWVFTVRPFSNAVESVILSLSLLTLTSWFKEPSATLSWGLGVLLSLGIFTRITFFLYGFPVGLGFLWVAYQKSSGRVQTFVASLIPFVLGGTVMAAVAIVVDSVYYGKLVFTFEGQPFNDILQVTQVLSDPRQWLSIRASGSFVLTPLNNLLYNMNVTNLENHGLHPRYLHLLVNLPLMFGPLGLGAIMTIIDKLRVGVQNDAHKNLYRVLSQIIILSLVGLSIMPHQEPRFLVPLLVPLTLIYTWNRSKLYISFWLIWGMFNIAVGYIFGALHQGGVVPTSVFLQRQALAINGCHTLADGSLSCHYGNLEKPSTDGYEVTTNIFFYKTYMPPEHLLGYPTAWAEQGKINVNVLDFSSNFDQLRNALSKRATVVLRNQDPHDSRIDFAKSRTGDFERTLLVAPSITMLPKLEGGQYLLMASFYPHLNFDDFGIIYNATSQGRFSRALLGLNVYLLLEDTDV